MEDKDLFFFFFTRGDCVLAHSQSLKGLAVGGPNFVTWMTPLELRSCPGAFVPGARLSMSDICYTAGDEAFKYELRHYLQIDAWLVGTPLTVLTDRASC